MVVPKLPKIKTNIFQITVATSCHAPVFCHVRERNATLHGVSWSFDTHKTKHCRGIL